MKYVIATLMATIIILFPLLVVSGDKAEAFVCHDSVVFLVGPTGYGHSSYECRFDQKLVVNKVSEAWVTYQCICPKEE